MKQTYDGSCHCGNFRFRATLDLADCIVCDCSICSRKGTIINRIEESDIELMTSIDELNLYTFNKHLAKHYFCPTCGIHPFHRPRTAPELWGVNVRCLSDVDIASLEPRQVFGSELD